MSSASEQVATQTSISVPRFVVPSRDRAVLVDPEYGELCDVARENSRRLSETSVRLHGVSIHAWREETRAAVLAQSREYTSSLIGEHVEPERPSLLFVTGHQPELFHAGVWAKNFAAGGLAQRTQGIALNLIVDNDTVTTTHVKVPTGSPSSPNIEWIPFDTAKPQQPWEESVIVDRDCFQSFGQRASKRIRDSWHYPPLVSTCWPAAIRHSSLSPRLCDCLAAARASVERSNGLRNLEVPMSRVCSTLPFCRFAALLLADLPRLHEYYNLAVREYRRLHHLKGRTHPVPELETADGWFEAPFWIWRTTDHRRERPFARRVGKYVELRDSRDIIVRLPLTLDHPLDAAASMLVDLARQGIRFRTRALTTTLFARVFLADLFFHGIGGAKYDAMTDWICEHFLGFQAPRFATVSATVHLPLSPAFPVTIGDLRTAQQQLRDLQYNPDRHFPGNSDSSSHGLIEEKVRLISAIASRRPTSVEHGRLTAINAELRSRLGDVEQDLLAGRTQIRQQLHANSVLQDREFSWSLQPESAVTFLRGEFPA